MSRASLSISAALAAAVLTSAPAALANGRFPESNQLLFAAHDPNLVVIRVTFGLLISHDRGRSFEWVCEESIGYSGVEDPMYAITPSNAILGSTFQGVSITRDNACRWNFAGGDLDSQVFIDLAANPNDAKNIVVFASAYDKQDDAGKILFTSRFWETKDEGQTFQQLGAPLDSTYLGYTVDLTKTDPNRLYSTVVRDPGPQPKGILLTSRNHGSTWEEESVQLLPEERSFYIAAVDPTNAERVYLRTYASSTDKPTRLILREADGDGGAPTQRTVYAAAGALLGFALTPDGSRVYVGGPKDGVQTASTTDFAFTQRSTLEVQCLGLNEDGLWACSNEGSTIDAGTDAGPIGGFVAGVSKDDGVTFEPRVHFCDLPGPLAACGPGTPTHDRCGERWPSQKALLGCGGDIGVPGDGGFTDAGGGFAPDPKRDPGGCDCHAAPGGSLGACAIGVGAALVLARRARRRRR